MAYSEWLARYHTQSSNLGLTFNDANALRRDAERLATLSTHDANGTLERCEEAGRVDHKGRPMIVGAVYHAVNHDGPGPIHYYRTRDMETPARARVEAIAATYGATVEWQGDPRGLPFALVFPNGAHLAPPCRGN